MKFGIVVGHNATQQGAVRQDTGETEYQWCSRLAQMIEASAGDYGIDVRVFYRTYQGSYGAEIRAVYAATDHWGADVTAELHFNGSENASATGTETLYSGSKRSLQLATAIQDAMVDELGLKDRGIKRRGPRDRGGASLHAGRAPAVLLEPFFGSNSKGQASTDDPDEMQSLAEAIIMGAIEGAGSMPRADLSGSRTIKAAQEQRGGAAAGIMTSLGAVGATVADQIVGDAETAIDAVSGVQVWAQYLPVAATFLTIAAIAAFLYMRVRSDRIEDARVDDHILDIR